MFSYAGLPAAQADRLKDEFGVYILRSGRICVAGLNSRNGNATAEAFAAVMACGAVAAAGSGARGAFVAVAFWRGPCRESRPAAG
jgi:hypothetical protein